MRSTTTRCATLRRNFRIRRGRLRQSVWTSGQPSGTQRPSMRRQRISMQSPQGTPSEARTTRKVRLTETLLPQGAVAEELEQDAEVAASVQQMLQQSVKASAQQPTDESDVGTRLDAETAGAGLAITARARQEPLQSGKAKPPSSVSPSPCHSPDACQAQLQIMANVTSGQKVVEHLQESWRWRSTCQQDPQKASRLRRPSGLATGVSGPSYTGRGGTHGGTARRPTAAGHALHRAAWQRKLGIPAARLHTNLPEDGKRAVCLRDRLTLGLGFGEAKFSQVGGCTAPREWNATLEDVKDSMWYQAILVVPDSQLSCTAEKGRLLDK